MASSNSKQLDDFVRPLAINTPGLLELTKAMTEAFRGLSRHSADQFLSTPISEPILRHVAQSDNGRFLAIDIGGTNLRVGFIELVGNAVGTNGSHRHGDGQNGHAKAAQTPSDRIRVLLERKEPIGEHLKNEKASDLFKWIGRTIAEVVRQGVNTFGLPLDVDLPMGVTFSFPMNQNSLSHATLMGMGKGFAITSNLDLGEHLMSGYDSHWTSDLPRIKIAAISNDSVATLVSHIYQFAARPDQKAVMGLIVGTGCNATILMKLSSLGEGKRPQSVSVLPGQEEDDVRIAVNTEWSINGSAPPLREFGLVSRWDRELDEAGEVPGFQPLEYMTAGRYLGELARLMFRDFLTTVLQHPPDTLPLKLQQKFGVTTTFLSHFYEDSKKGPMLDQLNLEFSTESDNIFQWTEVHAHVLNTIAKAVEVRAAGIVAASTLALLVCAEELPGWDSRTRTVEPGAARELVVGWTGGCIQHFQTYLQDTQDLMDSILNQHYEGSPPVRVVFSPCHDGGIKGAGILVPAALASQST